ncbi:MAG: hypothetical protein ACREFE_15975 [Limisphaerales bacterium]
MKQKSRKWIKRIAIGLLLLYPAYLLLLGPFWALDGRGRLDFVPSSVRNAAYLPLYPIAKIRPLFNVYDHYMDWWYLDPNAPETTE